MYATVVISRYHPDPRKVHLYKIQHLYEYLNKYTYTSINFNTEIPAYANFKRIEGNWGNLYAGETEDLPHSCPPPMGKPVSVSSAVDANLMKDLDMGISHTIISHMLNKTTI